MPNHDSTSVLVLRLRAVSNRLRESQLFLPAVMLLLAIVLEIVLSGASRRLQLRALPFGLRISSDAAISLLSTIAGATITTAGVVFSILVVSLQLASGQFSPRVLRSFYRDRVGQVIIGLLVSTFAFCVLAITSVDTTDQNRPPVPVLSVEIATVLALLSIFGIVGYLDRMSRRQYVGSIASRIADEALHVIADLQRDAVQMTAAGRVDLPDSSYVVPAPGSGWVQQLSRRLVVDALPDGSVVRLETRVGAFVVEGGPLATIWPAPPDAEQVAQVLDDAVIIGQSRTMQEDLDFGLRQLDDIALRALSPAVNDPTTAIEMVMRITQILHRLMATDLPKQALRDSRDRVLLHPWDLDHGEYVRHGFDQIRQAGANQPAVILAVVRSLRMLKGMAEERGRDGAAAEADRQIRLAVDGAAAAPGNLAEDIEPLRRAAADDDVTSEAENAEADEPLRRHPRLR